MAEYIDLVKEKEGEIKDLYQRMDDDKELAQLQRYVMQDWAGKAVKKAINVTLNKPAVFAANVEAALNNAIEQVSIVTEDKKVDKDHIADCVRAAFLSADSRLRAQGKWPLNPFIDQQMCRRGGAAARVTFHMAEDLNAEGKKTRVMNPVITTWDRRFISYETGKEGLSWAAYRTTRSKNDIIAEYLKILPGIESILGSKTSVEVVDFWNGEVNTVYVDNKQILEQPNPYGYPPVCVQLVTLGSMLADADALKYQGESIFFLIREIIPEKNRLISILQTLNTMSIKPAKTWHSKDAQQEAPEYDDAMAPGSMTPAETGGGVGNIDFGDAKASAIYALEVIDKALSDGSLEIIEVGSLPGPMSAVALIEIGEGRDQIFLPRLGGRGLLKQQIGDMIIRQIITSGESKVELGTKGRARTFDVKKLQGAYDLEFNYYVKSPKIDIARYSVAQVARAEGISRETRYRDILQLEDPDGEIARSDYELAAELSPLVKVRRIIKSLSEMDDDDVDLDAEILAAEFGLNVDKVLYGETPAFEQGQNQPAPAEKTLLPLFNERRNFRQHRGRAEDNNG